jgi:hypothetical protein
MPLNEAQLAAEIKAAFDDESDIDVNPADARERQANKIAAAIIRQFIAADVNSVVSGAAATGKIT